MNLIQEGFDALVRHLLGHGLDAGEEELSLAPTGTERADCRFLGVVIDRNQAVGERVFRDRGSPYRADEKPVQLVYALEMADPLLFTHIFRIVADFEKEAQGDTRFRLLNEAEELENNPLIKRYADAHPEQLALTVFVRVAMRIPSLYTPATAKPATTVEVDVQRKETL